ncbi:hypothetical protein DFP72DRAFT_844924 [Ephemerocybe angulata]|uniref:Uncharacterized protein n=1 Tax=Ephemerocybe angulata TaxID=980116 RepID=A0A8H6MB02_9AGAR|nr:hypothetical protein DFP72DRAFT_844924 [Tulosesus angulatus]
MWEYVLMAKLGWLGHDGAFVVELLIGCSLLPPQPAQGSWTDTTGRESGGYGPPIRVLFEKAGRRAGWRGPGMNRPAHAFTTFLSCGETRVEPIRVLRCSVETQMNDRYALRLGLLYRRIDLVRSASRRTHIALQRRVGLAGGFKAGEEARVQEDPEEQREGKQWGISSVCLEASSD